MSVLKKQLDAVLAKFLTIDAGEKRFVLVAGSRLWMLHSDCCGTQW